MALSPMPLVVGTDENPKPGRDGTTTWNAGLSAAVAPQSHILSHSLCTQVGRISSLMTMAGWSSPGSVRSGMTFEYSKKDPGHLHTGCLSAGVRLWCGDGDWKMGKEAHP